MLESGSTVFDCQVVKLLSENKVYQSYLVNCPDATMGKLLLLLPDPLFDQKQQQSFFDHASWLSGQTFPRIGSPLKTGEIDGQPACLYPFPPGEPLAKFLDENFSTRQTVKFIEKIAELLSVPHSANLYHGNLSPETVYSEANSPYLADFSLTQLIRMDYSSGINPQCTSPEQVRGEAPGTASDIYNLGCIFYHLLAGQPPFSGNDAFAIAKQHLQGDFPSLPDELSLFQPLLDSLVKTAAEDRITIDHLIEQIAQLSVQQNIDQISVSNPAENGQVDEVPPDEDISLLDQALDSAEIAARIEARLMEHAADFQETEPVEMPLEKDFDATDGLDQVEPKEKAGFWRFVLVLLLGIAIGSGLYFLFYQQPSVVPTLPTKVVEPTLDTEAILSADLDQGLRLWQEADFNGAEAEFKRIISEYPLDLRAYNNLASFYAAQGNYAQARDYLEQALATDENYAAVYRNLGSVYAEMARGSYGRALHLTKGEALISLPVFSSQGIIDLQSVVAAETTTEEQIVKKKPTAPDLLEAGQHTTVAELVTPDDTDTAQAIVTDQQEQPQVVIAQKDASVADREQQASVTQEEQQVPVAQEELLDEGASDKSAPVVLQQEKAEAFLRRWAQAWSDQDVAAYLTFYGEKFVPPAGKKRAAWETERYSRLTRPKTINVHLDNFKLIPQENGQLQIEVIQSYKSELLTDRTKKIFDLQPTEESWKIVRERSLGDIR